MDVGTDGGVWTGRSDKSEIRMTKSERNPKSEGRIFEEVGLRACLKIRFGVPPLGGLTWKPPKGGTPTQALRISKVFFKHALGAARTQFFGFRPSDFARSGSST